MVEQQVVHLPERSLVGGGFGRLGGELGTRMDVVERQMPPHVADVAEVAQQLADDRLGLAAVRALEVAVLDDRDRRFVGTADVVALGIDVDVRGRRAARRCRAARGSAARAGSSAVARKSSQVTIDATSAALRMPSFASSSCCPSNASVAMSSETVKPMPAIVPPPATAAQPTGGRSRPPRQPRDAATSRRAIPTGLPTT